jgi:excisionase family DNA binding protein
MPVDLKTLEGKAYNPDEVAQILKMHGDTVRRLCKSGRLKAAKPRGSKCYIILGEDVVRYLKGEPAIPEGGKPDGRKA